VPCWLRELDDDAAYMLLLTSNAQGELSPLERGMHALGATQKGKHTQSVNAYAQAIGVPSRTVSNWVQAAEVYHKVCLQGQTLNLIERTKHLIEIHAAPQWLWPMAVAGAGRGAAGKGLDRRADQIGGTAGQGRSRAACLSRHRRRDCVGQDVGMVASATVARPVRVPDRYPYRAARRHKLHSSCRSRNYRIVPPSRRAPRIGGDVTQLTLAEAAKAADRSKSALLRSIKAGRLSATR
jgi:hypothetical protein